MASPVDGRLAERVAVRGSPAASRSPPVYHADSLGPDFAELTAEAEELVGRGHRAALAGRPGARPGGRPGRLDPGQPGVVPAAAAAAARQAGRPHRPSALARFAPKVAGAEVGMLLGWMSGRVLGQYDLLVVEDETADDQDLVYYVGPNLLALEKRFGFPPGSSGCGSPCTRCTHRAQFTGVPWMREHFLGLVAPGHRHRSTPTRSASSTR